MGYWWNGISDYHGREKYNYCGGILGGNFKYALTYPEFIENVVYDEGKMEKMFLDKPFVDKFNSKELFYMNIKVPNNKDMTCYNKLLKYNEDNIIQFENLNEKIRQKFESEFNMFINL